MPGDPDQIQRLLEAALAEQQSGHLEEAHQLYQRILQLDPDQPLAHFHLGDLLWQQGDTAAARDCYAKLTTLQPQFPQGHFKLALTSWQIGRGEQAQQAMRSAITLAHDNAQLLANMADALSQAGALSHAIRAYRRAVELSPDDIELHRKLGLALEKAGDAAGALDVYRVTTTRWPQRSAGHNDLGIALTATGDYPGAIAAFDRAISLAPGDASAWNNLASALGEVGRIDDYLAALRRAMDLAPAEPTPHSNLCCALLYHPDITLRQTLDEPARWNQRHAQPLLPASSQYSNDRQPQRRLRIGYISPDFRDHVVGQNIWPLLKHHDHQSFHITCYSSNPADDALTEQFRALADEWRDIASLPDERVAELIRRDGIDVLVDLAVHTSGNRLLVLARRPAPVQVTFAGYPGTTGMPAIDYRLTDPLLDPDDPKRDALYVERSVRLPSFWCYEPFETGPNVNELPAATSGVITFGCLSRFSKVNDFVAQMWAQVLRHTPRSRMIVLAPPGDHRDRLIAKMQVDPQHVEFIPRISRAQYLTMYHRIDLCLDTFPYNGHTTTLDALWMGVPTVSLCGETAVTRAGWSQMNSVGLPQLVATSREQFIEIAVALAADLDQLTQTRRSLRQRMENSVLCDGPLFARSIESAYRTMWRRWCISALR